MSQSIVPVGPFKITMTLHTSYEVALDVCCLPKWSAATDGTKGSSSFRAGHELDNYLARQEL